MSETTSIGERLKTARLERGLSLADVAEQTKISQTYLNALERDDHSMFPAAVYGVGFLRQYAQALGLPADELVSAFRKVCSEGQEAITKSAPQPAQPDADSTHASVAQKIGLWRGGVIGERANLLAAGILLLVGGLAWWYVSEPSAVATSQRASAPTSSVESSAAESVSTTTPQTAPRRAARRPTPTSPLRAQPGSFAPAAPGQISPAASIGMLGVELLASGEVWVRTVVDGGSPQEAVLKPGNRHTLRAEQRVQFTAGNAGAITLLVDGQEQASIGEAGEVRHIEVQRSGWKPVPAGSF